MSNNLQLMALNRVSKLIEEIRMELYKSKLPYDNFLYHNPEEITRNKAVEAKTSIESASAKLTEVSSWIDALGK